MSSAAWAAILLAASAVLSAQSQPPPSFEVASIKPSPANCTIPGDRGGPTPGRLDLPCLPVRSLIRVAYGSLMGNTLAARRMQVLGGPSWLDTDRYDISAKTEGSASVTERLGPMLR